MNEAIERIEARAANPAGLPALPMGKTYDARFRRLLPDAQWQALPEAVKRRFSKRIEGGALATYQGQIVETQHSPAGWLLAQLCRAIGAPLPLYRDKEVPASVCVSEDMAGGGQCWTRIYGRRRGFPQVIHSAKRFAGPTGLEEYIGHRVGMALCVHGDSEGLRFESDHYFLQLGKMRLRLPKWLCPGDTLVVHCDLGEGRFAFDLVVSHPLLGELVRQHAIFRDG